MVQFCDLRSCWKPPWRQHRFSEADLLSGRNTNPCVQQNKSIQDFSNSHGIGGSVQAYSTGKSLNMSYACIQTPAKVFLGHHCPQILKVGPLEPTHRFQACQWCAIVQHWTIREDSKGFQKPLWSQCRRLWTLYRSPPPREKAASFT